MMNLTHRNRVAYSRLNRLEIQRCDREAEGEIHHADAPSPKRTTATSH